MKPRTKDKPRLKLDRERVRVLDRQELDQVMGGNVPNQTRGPIAPGASN